MVDPMIEDTAAVDNNADEDAREQRWAEFVLDCSRFGHARMASAAAAMYEWSRGSRINVTMDMALTEDEQIVMNFAQSEGWSGVFAALARAIREQEA